VLNDANQNLIYRALRKIKQVVKNVTKGCIAGHLSPLSILKLRIGPDAQRTSLTAPCCGVVCCLCNLMHFDGGEQPQNCPFPWEYTVPWSHPSPQPKRHLDRFIRFCRAHGCDQQTHRQTGARYIFALRPCDAA